VLYIINLNKMTTPIPIPTPMYVIFGGFIFYPEGGFNDIYGFAQTFQEALKIYDEALTIGSKHISDWNNSTYGGYGIDAQGNRKFEICCWAHIVNMHSKKIVVNSVKKIDR